MFVKYVELRYYYLVHTRFATQGDKDEDSTRTPTQMVAGRGEGARVNGRKRWVRPRPSTYASAAQDGTENS